jgi:hypothetical protein
MNSHFFESEKAHCQSIIPSMLGGCMLLFFSNIEVTKTDGKEQLISENVGSKGIMFYKGSDATIDCLSIS